MPSYPPNSELHNAAPTAAPHDQPPPTRQLHVRPLPTASPQLSVAVFSCEGISLKDPDFVGQMMRTRKCRDSSIQLPPLKQGMNWRKGLGID